MPEIPLTWDGTDANGQPLRWDTPGLTWDGFLPQLEPAKPMPIIHVNLGFATDPKEITLETAISSPSIACEHSHANPVRLET